MQYWTVRGFRGPAGRLIDPLNWKMCTLFDINCRPRPMTVEELSRGFRKLAVELYGDEFTAWRRGRFRKMLRERRRIP